LPNIQSYTVYTYGSGQPQPYYRTPYIWCIHIRYFWQGNCQIYSHIRCIYTVLANPNHITVHHIYGVYTYGIFGREIAKYSHIRCIYTVLANPNHITVHHIYGVYTYGIFGREITKYSHIRCIYTVLANPRCVTITVVRRNFTSTVRTVQTVTVPYRTTRQAWSYTVYIYGSGQPKV